MFESTIQIIVFLISLIFSYELAIRLKIKKTYSDFYNLLKEILITSQSSLLSDKEKQKLMFNYSKRTILETLTSLIKTLIIFSPVIVFIAVSFSDFNEGLSFILELYVMAFSLGGAFIYFKFRGKP